MKCFEKGFTMVELVVALSIMAIVSGAVVPVVFQTDKFTAASNERLGAVRQVQNTGYWIGRDTRMADAIITNNLTPPNFLVLTWSRSDYSSGNTTYHSVTYSFVDLDDGIGKLKRSYWSDVGGTAQTVIAERIYYNPDDPANTSSAGFSQPLLSIKLVSQFGDTSEAREYRIVHRPNLN